MGLSARSAAMIIGIVFIAIGVLGFIPNPLVSPIGIFVTDPLHNVVHLVSGMVLLAGVYSSLGASTALKIIGVVYGLVAILGVLGIGVSNGMLLGLIHINNADNWLHIVLALVILYAGFGLETQRAARAM
jgi:hypothetical protein